MEEPVEQSQSLSVPQKKIFIKRQLSDHRGSIHYAAVRAYVYDEIIYPALKRLEKETGGGKAVSEVTIRDVVEDLGPKKRNSKAEDMNKRNEINLKATPININNNKQEDDDNEHHRKRSFCLCC